jgi:hypothetical protein
MVFSWCKSVSRYLLLIQDRTYWCIDIYWTAFPSDQWHTKALVYTLFILDTLQSILLARDGFATFAAGFGDLAQLDNVGLVWFSVPVLAALGS